MGISLEGLVVDGIAPDDHAKVLLPDPALNGKTQPRSLITTALIYTETIQIKLHSRERRNGVERIEPDAQSVLYPTCNEEDTNQRRVLKPLGRALNFADFSMLARCWPDLLWTHQK